MNRHELEERYHNVMDITLNSLQQLFLLTQQMAQQLNDSDRPFDIRQQLLENLEQIDSTSMTIRAELHSFSSVMEAFLRHLDMDGPDTDGTP